MFHSSHALVWEALAASLADAGLVVTAASILDKTQASFKQVNGHVAVSGDPLLRVRKCSLESTGSVTGKTTTTMRDLALAELRLSDRQPVTARQEQRRYSELVGAALVGGVPITMDAREVYGMRGAD